MITHITKGTTMEYRGSQNDVKPLNVANGSVFVEIESGAKYLYDAENSLWMQWNETGISDEKIQDAVDSYLEEHPVSGEDLVARAGVSQLSESVDEIPKTYLKLQSFIVDISIVKNDGIINTTLVPFGTNFSRYKHSIVDVYEGDTYIVTCYSANDAYCGAFFRNSENGNVLLALKGSGVGYTEELIKVPDGYNQLFLNSTYDNSTHPIAVKQVRVQKNEDFWHEYGTIKSKVESIDAYRKLNGKNVLIMGDSIAYGEGATNRTTDAWYAKFANLTNANVTNIAIDGSKIQYTSYEGVAKSIYTLSEETDFSEYDIIIIWAGTNDYTGGVVGDVDSEEKNNACGGLALAIRNIMQSNPLIKIIYFAPMYRDRILIGDGKNSDDYPNAGVYLYEYADKLEAVARKNHVPCKNMYREFLLNRYNASQLLNDGLHPNNLGHERLANIIADFVEQNV